MEHQLAPNICGERIKDRRFQVFISSTFRDLHEERKKAISVVVDQHHIPIALENFSASHSTDFEVIESAIKDSQIYLVILGHRYGEIAEGKDKSYTEIEYDMAVQNGLLILPFVLCAEERNSRRKELDPEKDTEKKEIENSLRLDKFLKKIQKLFFKPWSTKDDFKYLVLDALKDAVTKCKRKGLVWETIYEQNELLAYASKNEFIVQTVKSITRFEYAVGRR